MINWIKRGNFSNLEDIILHNTGLTKDEFLNAPDNVFILGLKEAAAIICEAIENNSQITIFGDYDADGVTSSAILYRMLMYLNASNVRVRLPKRFSEGYGISELAIDEIDEGLIITVDNGISAIDAIKKAKDKGIKVLILDHHLGTEDGVLPEADVIVDPNAIAGSEFSKYCGAGLAFKLCQLMVDDKAFIEKMNGLAAIGTIADVVDLTMDNRNIVKRGLENINSRKNVIGLNKLFESLSIYECDEGKIGFLIAPIINACGRMRDDGAMSAFRLFVTNDVVEAKTLAMELIELNEERKKTVAEGMLICDEIIREQCLFGESPLIICSTNDSSEKQLHEGVVGIIAGRLSEKYSCPAFVLTETEDGVLKGSGRTNDSLHLKALLDSVSEYLLNYGGHAGAAGLSIEKHKFDDFKCAIQDAITSFDSTSSVNDKLYYDLEVSADEIPAITQELKEYAPFGEGNPKPIFKITDIRLVPRGGAFYKLMGNNSQHIKLYGNEFDIVAFDYAEVTNH